jgi:hypothetical protein
MNAIISNGNYTARVQLPVERRQLAGALSYLHANHAILNHCDLTFARCAHGNFANALFYKCDLKCGQYINSCFENTRFMETEHISSTVTMDDCVTDEEWCDDQGMEDGFQRQCGMLLIR